MKTTDLAIQSCPFCGSKHEAASSPFGNYKPRTGDWSVCLYCNQVGVFGDGLILRKPTAEEHLSIIASPEITELQLVRHGLALPIRKTKSP
jgi:hypothetical protein